MHTCSITILPGSSSCWLPLGALTPKNSGARGATLGPCACSAATSAEVGVKLAPTGTHVSVPAYIVVVMVGGRACVRAHPSACPGQQPSSPGFNLNSRTGYLP